LKGLLLYGLSQPAELIDEQDGSLLKGRLKN